MSGRNRYRSWFARTWDDVRRIGLEASGLMVECPPRWPGWTTYVGVEDKVVKMAINDAVKF